MALLAPRKLSADHDPNFLSCEHSYYLDSAWPFPPEQDAVYYMRQLCACGQCHLHHTFEGLCQDFSRGSLLFCGHFEIVSFLHDALLFHH